MTEDDNRSDSLNILVVEDSIPARMGIVSTLKGVDARIHEADDGLTAYEFLKRDPSKIDLVLSDLVMKKMHGDELCKRIRNDLGLSDLPIVILSSKSDKESIIKLFRAGASDYLFKPFTPEELVARISTHLNQRSLNKILKTTIEALKESNRLKDHFLAACSHDFRSPLQGILGYTELLISDNSLNETHKNILRKIINSGSQLNELIESLLDFPLAGKQFENMTLVPVKLSDLITSCVGEMSLRALEKGINLNFAPRDDLPLISGNANALYRVFNNLLSNAVKFTPPGGIVTVEVQPADDHTLCVSIKDNGIGIAEDAMPAIFDFYTKTSRKGTQGEKSTGLGLFISRKLVNLHNGKILVNSQIDEGSCFTVVLPIKDPGIAY